MYHSIETDEDFYDFAYRSNLNPRRLAAPNRAPTARTVSAAILPG